MRNAASVAALALVAAALLGGGGSGSSRLLWIGGLALLAPAGGYAALGARLSRAGAALLAALAGLAVWDGASIGWSVGPDLSWDATNRTFVYLGFACLGAAVAPSARWLAYGLAVACGAAVLWALLAKAAPGLYPDYGRIARLRSPVGYWNALAQVGDALLPLGLWLFGRRSRLVSARGEAARPRREGRSRLGRGLPVSEFGVVLAYAAAIAVVLTYSRSGIAFA